MALLNSRIAYGRVAKWLHWGVALFVLGSYGTMYARQWFTEEHSYWHGHLAQLHFSIGLSIGCLMVLRLFWRWLNPRPSLAHVRRWRRRGARLSHALFYMLLLAMPILGYLATGAEIHYFDLFDITPFQDTAAFKTLAAVTPVNDDNIAELLTVHRFIGEYILWVLIALHAGAGFHHHFAKRDNTLRRMTTGV